MTDISLQYLLQRQMYCLCGSKNVRRNSVAELIWFERHYDTKCGTKRFQADRWVYYLLDMFRAEGGT